MARALPGFAMGVIAAALATLGHVAGGGAASPIVAILLTLASAIVFSAATELRAPMWALAALGALVQVAGHLLLAPLGGHSGAGGHAHGMPGQMATGELGATVAHLADGGLTMIAMHAVAFAAVITVLALAAPLAGLLVPLQRILTPVMATPARRLPARFRPAALAASVTLRHIVIRRGPPAFV